MLLIFSFFTSDGVELTRVDLDHLLIHLLVERLMILLLLVLNGFLAKVVLLFMAILVWVVHENLGRDVVITQQCHERLLMAQFLIEELEHVHADILGPRQGSF